MTDLSVLIPARNEMFLARTIQDIIEHAEGDTEVIAVCDGNWPDPPVGDHPRVTLIYHPEAIGQRAGVNEAARIATGKYVMKCDAHCSFDQGFDVKLMADMQDDWTVVPIMRNLHAFDWVCPNGHRRYQGPSGPCKECGAETTREVVWYAKPSPQSTSYCFDAEPHFQYFGQFKHRPEGRGDLTETMSLQGSCFMMTRQRYFELNVCDEEYGFWGSQGIEVACKSWLSGGRVLVNHKTYYAHMFRTQGGDFSFPYPMTGKQTQYAKQYAREQFFNRRWEKQVKPLSWLVEKFWPVQGWTEENLAALKIMEGTGEHKDAAGLIDHNGGIGVTQPIASAGDNIPSHGVGLGTLTKGVIYYTDNRLDPLIMNACQMQLRSAVNGHRIVSISLHELDFGENIVLSLERGYLTLFKQILAGLEASTADVVFFCEHDILYHPSHFEFVPPDRDTYYYNLNCWKVDYKSGHAVTYTTKQVSQLCAYRELLVAHYRERVRRTEQAQKTMNDHDFKSFIRRQGFEPGSHNRAERVDEFRSDVWRSASPNIDIRHNLNLTPSRWRQDQFRDQRNCRDWQEAECVDGWYEAGKFQELLKGL